jgi:hypothetical protein
MYNNNETIYAPLTIKGRCSVYVIRISGKATLECLKILGVKKELKHREATVCNLKDYLNNTGATIDAKKKIVERGREVEKALNFVADGIHARNPLTREDADFITQLTSGGIRTYRKPKFSFDFSLTGSDYNANLSKDRKHVTMG